MMVMDKRRFEKNCSSTELQSKLFSVPRAGLSFRFGGVGIVRIFRRK